MLLHCAFVRGRLSPRISRSRSLGEQFTSTSPDSSEHGCQCIPIIMRDPELTELSYHTPGPLCPTAKMITTLLCAVAMITRRWTCGLILGICTRACAWTRPVGIRMQLDITAVEILKSSLGRKETLPLTYVATMPFWALGGDGQATKVPGLGGEGESEGWVDPSGYTEFWLPADLSPPTAQAAVCFIIKGGVPRYLCPGLEISTVDSEGNRLWRNWGQNSLPVARSWLPVDSLTLNTARLSVLLSDPANGVSTVEDDLASTIEVEQVGVAGAVNELSRFLADPPEAFVDEASSFQRLNVVLPGVGPVKIPAPGGRMRVYLGPAEPSDIMAGGRGQADTTCLNVKVVEVAPGGRSEYMPEVYKALYRH